MTGRHSQGACTHRQADTFTAAACTPSFSVQPEGKYWPNWQYHGNQHNASWKGAPCWVWSGSGCSGHVVNAVWGGSGAKATHVSAQTARSMHPCCPSPTSGLPPSPTAGILPSAQQAHTAWRARAPLRSAILHLRGWVDDLAVLGEYTLQLHFRLVQVSVDLAQNLAAACSCRARQWGTLQS